MPNYLTAILERKKREIATLVEPVSFSDVLKQEGLTMIAEIKRRSPSKGDLNPSLDPAGLAKEYIEGGARAISVLTDEVGFGGTLHDLRAVIEACPGVPVLRKDFIVDLRQLYETARTGAHAVLLITSALGDRLAEFIRVSHAYGLEALVEVHDLEELQLAQKSGAKIIGVNNRDLVTFDVSIATSEKLAPHISPEVIKIAESGILSADDALRMRAAGYDAILVGEALVKSKSLNVLLQEMIHAH